MRVHAALALVLMAAPALAGCLGGEAEPTDDIVRTSMTNTVTGTAPGAPVTPLDVTLQSSAMWTRPGETVTLTAASADSATFEWFLAPRAAAAAASDSSAQPSHHMLEADGVGDGPFASTFGPGAAGHSDAPAKPARTPPAAVDTGEIQPGVYSEPITLEEDGLYQFHCHPHPWMSLNIVVSNDASLKGTQHIEILDGKTNDDYRFVPDDLRVQPGTKLTFWNNGTAVHTGTQGGFAWLIPETGNPIAYAPEETGDFDVLVIAKDGQNARGEARTRLFVDPEKPDEVQPVGPFRGEFQKGVPNDPQPETKDHSFTSPFDITSLALTFTATSDVPVPPSVTVSLLQDGKEIAAADASDSGEIKAADLPAGTYTLRVTAAQGVLIAYEVKGTATLELVAPDAAAAGGGGHH